MRSIERFRGLLEAESEANRRVFESLESVPEGRRGSEQHRRAFACMAHNQLARRVWLMRLTDTAYDPIRDWFPVWPLERIRREAAAADHAWREHLALLDEPGLDRELTYTSSEGMRYSSTVDEILTHVFTHSTYHRGQVARLVTECGGQRASTDYIVLTRRRL
jgi:uncharacterized damage-inducible protein DinB